MAFTWLRQQAARLCLVALALPLLSACASTGKLTINLMPAPGALIEGLLRRAWRQAEQRRLALGVFMTRRVQRVQ